MTGNPVPRVAIVTGASRGLGREIALAFGRGGDRVIVNYLAKDECAAATVDAIEQAGGQACACRADIGNGKEIASMVSRVMDRWGRIDVLVNNAGRTKDQLLLRMTEQDWDVVMETNLKGPFLTTRAVAAIMTQQGSGHIINIASIVGMQGREGQANYAASKAGVLGLTKAAARELGPSNVQVNAVLPGYLETDMGGTLSMDMRDRVRSQNVLKRFSAPREIAEFIYHLSWMKNVSGQVFNLDSRIF